jgi:hypothetical protein
MRKGVEGSEFDDKVVIRVDGEIGIGNGKGELDVMRSRTEPVNESK